ncbi:hypothetical protein SAMN03097699_0446 [Flavobacteriaceae bacterium MAR_2010_188]|nr:hypothetical protein SAMN03097699_0446 [Flavobacteriaceae bacterium MAR_2010_188]
MYLYTKFYIMEDKKSITKQFIIKNFMDYVLVHGQQPPTVYSFAKENHFEEAEFYTFYGSFDAVEKDIFNSMFVCTMAVLTTSEDYLKYDARTKLLSFYYTFFENLTANRSYVMQALKKDKGKKLYTTDALNGMKKEFKLFINSLNIEKIELQNANLDKFQDKSMSESAWIQLLLTIKFWMDDESPNFEKTDIFIEKSINTTFDFLDVAPVKSLIDFGKFIWKEKIRM